MSTNKFRDDNTAILFPEYILFRALKMLVIAQVQALEKQGNEKAIKTMKRLSVSIPAVAFVGHLPP